MRLRARPSRRLSVVTQLTRALPLEPMSAHVRNSLLPLQNAVLLSRDPGKGLHDGQALGPPGSHAPSALGQFLPSLSYRLAPSHPGPPANQGKT